MAAPSPGTSSSGVAVACRSIADEAGAESAQLEEPNVLQRALNALLPFTRGVDADIQRQV